MILVAGGAGANYVLDVISFIKVNKELIMRNRELGHDVPEMLGRKRVVEFSTLGGRVGGRPPPPLKKLLHPNIFPTDQFLA